jgi:acyl-CoA thioesterase FadM
VVLELDERVDDERLDPASLFARGRSLYLERCSGLAAFLEAEDAALLVTAAEVGPIVAAHAGGLMVGVSVVEVRPSSFDMAVRIRPTGDDAGSPANGRCTMAIQRRATGERIAIPREIRDEFIAIQLAARDMC